MLLYTRNATGISAAIAYPLSLRTTVGAKEYGVAQLLNIMGDFWLR